MSYRINITSAAERQFKELPRRFQINIRDAIYSLSDEPRPEGCKKHQSKKNLWRIRVGNYRVVYQIKDKELIVLILRIGNRKEIYQKLGRMKL